MSYTKSDKTANHFCHYMYSQNDKTMGRNKKKTTVQGNSAFFFCENLFYFRKIHNTKFVFAIIKNLNILYCKIKEDEASLTEQNIKLLHCTCQIKKKNALRNSFALTVSLCRVLLVH